jgi:hypothetical protein
MDYLHGKRSSIHEQDYLPGIPVHVSIAVDRVASLGIAVVSGGQCLVAWRTCGCLLGGAS